ncbi:MAG: hypothetical protein A2V66_13940 [Ignavibacteria bacterium RBG_13_36_8]|nr:MAG: hypothetical protein A2V66_13940 [Ignavibacteria bacterium RBG_13_36_8]
MKNLLLIDDEAEMLSSLEKILSTRRDFNISKSKDSTAALKLVKQKKFDLIITDLKMKDVSGMDIMKTALIAFPESIVLIISGYGTIQASVEAMREGAFDFLEKPFTSQKLFDCIDRAFKKEKNEESITKIKKEEVNEISSIIFESKQMANVIQMIKKIAPGNMNVLITGESGTGKELVARAIHNLSRRKIEPFVPVNCGALPEHLFESELFGHERGAFTGAIKTKPGLLEFANRGTFFFDEIGEMSLSLQVKLLRMLEERKIRRVGGQDEIIIDVRIITATNTNLEQAVIEKKFREDLYYRLNTLEIEIPPLRDRPSDIMLLSEHFLHELMSKNDKIVNGFSSEAQKALKSYSWPGNVRELQNMIGRAYILCSTQVIQRDDLPLPVVTNRPSFENLDLDLPYKEAKDMVLERFEVDYLTHNLRKNNGNISRTAQECGLDRRSIHRLLLKHNIIYKE